ncbi:DUF4381 domain-containing protein [Pseudomonas sp. Q1-7]|uniref:DUF4381 domain-containing protein n=1 Tax=Pseudomonas sp. Q1-7 TaxID=3020843 RepID=UPI00230018E4|nr:DUF4381 domain-containing protein [Pseudomonas sp. Q1-7]
MNPLDELEPLIAPAAVAWWPPAPGWWCLPPLFGLLAWGLWYWRRRATFEETAEAEQPLDPARQAALDELAHLPKPYDGAPAGPWLQELNGLLKRVCRQHYPADQSHTLSGRAWLAYLDNRCPAAGLTRWMILVEGAYRPQCKLDDKAIAGLYQSVETWVRKHV